MVQTPKTTDQQTKEEYMEQCIASGKTEEECTAAWNEAHKTEGDDPKSKSHSQLVAENEMLKVKLDQANKLLTEATRIFKLQKEERDAKIEADKYGLATEIARDSEGKYAVKDLMAENYETLSKMKKVVDIVKSPDFVSVSTLLDESTRKKQPQLSVGEWDPIAKKYKGGI